MILTKYNISILLIFLISALFPNKSNNHLLYNYYIQNSSSNTIESDLIHTLEFRDTSLEIDGKYENFLNEYYGKYEKENLRFINAVVEPDIFYISTSIGASNIIVGENKYSFGRTIGFHIDSPYAFKVFKKIIVIVMLINKGHPLDLLYTKAILHDLFQLEKPLSNGT